MSIIDQIAEVLGAHRWATRARRDWDSGVYECRGCKHLSSSISEHETHVAEKIAKLFGKERIPANDPIYEPHQSRWVSAWFPDA